MGTFHHALPVIGYACGIGAGNPLCEAGPLLMQSSPYMDNVKLDWKEILTPKDFQQGIAALNDVVKISERLAEITFNLTQQRQFFVTVGGDHTCALGTWSGVTTALLPNPCGLLWIDAHLDSHTMQTTPSGNIHGMPLAALLGYGDAALTNIFSPRPKFAPSNVCILGARSFEPEEKALLERLNVRIYYMEEIKRRGFEKVFDEAINIITAQTHYYGVSLDLDGIDPNEAPGVGTPAPDGIPVNALMKAFRKLVTDPRFVGTEIAEFNPKLDQQHKTEMIIANILKLFSKK